MKKVLAILIALALVAGALYFFIFRSRTDSTVVKNYPSSGKNVIAFGDSLIKGKGSTEGNDFVSDISRDLSVPILNYGENGDTTAQGLDRIDDVLKHDPKVVLLLFGGNDVLQRVPADETFKNIETMIQKIQEKGAVVILLGIPDGIILSDPYEKRYRALADKYDTAYVPNVLSDILGHSELLSDEVHPNDAGYRKIANRIEPVVKKLTR